MSKKFTKYPSSIKSSMYSNLEASKKTTRGTSYRVSGEKRYLRDIVDTIYDEVEMRNIIDYFANIKSAGKRYYIDYFRRKSGWMLEDDANELAKEISDLIDELGFSKNARIELIPENMKSLVDEYGDTVYIVRVIVENS